MNSSDKALLTAIYEFKDEKAFKSFYDKYANLLLNWTIKRTQNKDLSEDIVQNFWVVFWSKPYAIKTDDDGCARKYLIHYFSYRMLDYLRTSASKTFGNDFPLESIKEQDSYLHIIEDIQVNELLEMIDNVLQNFPEFTQDIFTKVWNDNLTVKEASIALNVSEKVIRSHFKKVMTTVQDQTNTMMGNKTKVLLKSLLLIATV
ncbi:RNA polymerase sigma-70 factor [Formosa agariphila KMM 3901]|uniref:RNA polymerase sigma-70 factor n=1 Tax=Formosa agariphila (strain DSM 15362 / KCTC 12365 / LMG 23005 / KMM 3901 / M-2Alg 35-1) TaxID=1347342 RepID=T2KPE4_FORAG|nr:sigma-70 family RNA polymerase sigma factor [Formosa agariphila]CDF80316.1 RNA polymerase sigma-70 factor [Formosa agariphila KMM 3901]